jgi:hypothetical protein
MGSIKIGHTHWTTTSSKSSSILLLSSLFRWPIASSANSAEFGIHLVGAEELVCDVGEGAASLTANICELIEPLFQFAPSALFRNLSYSAS